MPLVVQDLNSAPMAEPTAVSRPVFLSIGEMLGCTKNLDGRC